MKLKAAITYINTQSIYFTTAYVQQGSETRKP